MATTMASPGSLRTLLNIEEELKRLNATMDRIEPFLAANKPTTERAYCCLRSTMPGSEDYHSPVARQNCICPCHAAKNAPTSSQEAQQPREDLKPVVREGDEEFSALSARMFEALEIAHHGQIEGHFACECGRNAGECLRWDRICKSGDTLMALRPRYDDYKAQQSDHDATDREDAER